MGSVWVADHLTLGTQVAVKFISRDLAAEPQMLTRFQREATAAAQIKSPHVVQVFDNGVTDDGQPYIVMELLHGEDLDVRIERLGRLSLAETLVVVRHTCKALAVAHRLGIVHRDIKPANLFVVDVEGEPFVKVLDFGIAKRRSEPGHVSGLTSTGAMVGTPHFMSPEQVTSSRDAAPSSDLWAVAVVAYSCLLGRRPFEGETVGALAIAINSAHFLAPSMVDPTLPPALDAWFDRALARELADRFASAKELADAFVAAVPVAARSLRPQPSFESLRTRIADAPTVVASAPARASPQTLGGASVRTNPRRKRARALVGAGLAVVAAGAVMLWLATPRGIDAAPPLASAAATAAAVPASTPASGSAAQGSTTAAEQTLAPSSEPAPLVVPSSATATPSHTALRPPRTRSLSSASSAPATPPPLPKDRGF